MYETDKPQPTAYLDGLRGIASLIVFSFHTLWAYSNLVEYGYGDGPKNQHFLQLPFIRLIHAGHAMVPVFFVVGGYVMALKPLRRVRSHESKNLHVHLAGFVFRKAMRLYVPAIIMTSISMLTLQFGMWEYPRHFIMNPRLFNYPDKHPPPEPTLAAELSRWVGATVGLSRIFSYFNDGFVLPYYNPYDPHLWYLPFELRSTLAVAATLLALSRCRRPAIRMSCILAAAVLSCRVDRWECALFLSGALLADVEMCCRFVPHHHHRRSSNTATTTIVAVFALLLPALYLLSTPNLRIRHTPHGYAHLISLVPPTITDPKRFLHGLGAILLLAALLAAPPLRAPFASTRLATAAARRSYALYVVHGPVLHVVGYGVAGRVWRAVGLESSSSSLATTGAFVKGERAKVEWWTWAVGAGFGSAAAWAVAWVVAGVFERAVGRWLAGWAAAVEGWVVREVLGVVETGEGEKEGREGALPR
ncbi:hypothetical protein BK809_0006466 [Diplodia seriata]|uniref:Acyltransferase 3 domain-containing protein n=1 Tax=Diplodia seriata TaxID=420778 RepID=A0A1S8B438_9PEZI|nr:hypothetical protein BK809_0006466 [Diplodia seriata]